MARMSACPLKRIPPALALFVVAPVRDMYWSNPVFFLLLWLAGARSVGGCTARRLVSGMPSDRAIQVQVVLE